MYREQSKGWLKHFDFAVLDVLCLQLSFWLSYALTGHRMDTFQTSIFKSMAVFLLMADIMVIFSFSTLKNVMKRGNDKEFKITLEHAVILEASVFFYLFMLQRGHLYSRRAFFLMPCIYVAISFVTRVLWKRYVRSRMKRGKKRNALLIVTTSDIAEEVVERVKENNFSGYYIDGLVLLDQKEAARTESADAGADAESDTGDTGADLDSGGTDQTVEKNGDQEPEGKRVARLPVVADAESAPCMCAATGLMRF